MLDKRWTSKQRSQISTRSNIHLILQYGLLQLLQAALEFYSSRMLRNALIISLFLQRESMRYPLLPTVCQVERVILVLQ